jgi:riboflavin biosynthesis pyrimidine reductase
MSDAEPFQLLYGRSPGRELPLPADLRTLYGPLRMPAHRGRPHVVANFASTLDGVVSLSPSGRSGGGEITGFDPHDRILMGLLRAAADAVIIGAGTLRAVPRHRWTADRVYPKLSESYGELRAKLHQPLTPLNVVVTARGQLDLELPIFRSGDVRVLIVTTERGALRVRESERRPWVEVATARGAERLTARSILEEVVRLQPSRLVLVEGGPHLFGDFLSEGRLDELFLTVRPEVAGRDARHPRLSLVEGTAFAPERPRPASLVDVRRGGDLLMLRLAFPGTPSPPPRH